ncbi:MAG TPA: TnsA endonuclease N-terminal domain-containing protein [Methylotenera sp.]|nr:TnsA endonuclease N-terminal domain-containing protein [Methylotenera sp.]
MKVRKVVTRGGRKFRVLFPSKKLRRYVECESLLERDGMLIVEFSPGVVRYQEQPVLIEYEEDGEMRRYYPDLEVVLISGEIIHIEIKPASKLISVEIKNKFNAIKAYYDRIGRRFIILLDSHIRVEPRLSNLKRIATGYCRPEHYASLVETATRLVKDDLSFTVPRLAQILKLSHVLALIGDGTLCCELNKDLFAADNYLRLSNGEDDDSLLF